MSTARHGGGLVIALLTACLDPSPGAGVTGAFPGAADSTMVATDSATETVDPVACDPVEVAVGQEWTEGELPARESVSHTSPGLGLGDIDGDGDPDILMAYGGGSTLLLNDGSGRFEQAAADRLDGGPLPAAAAAALLDIDGDGDVDGYLGRASGLNDLLLINDGTGAFTAQEIPDSAYGTWTASFGDMDGDRDLDLVIGTFDAAFDPEVIMSMGATGAGFGVFLQDDAGGFARLDGAVPQAAQIALTLEPALIDFDMDGDLDVYMANDFGPYVLPNQLLINDGSGRLTRAEDCGCDVAMYAMGAAVGDANGDGWPDLFLSNVGPPKLLVNDRGGGFIDDTLASGADIPASSTNLTSWGTAFLDINQDTCEDIVIVYGYLSTSFDVNTLEGADDWVDGGQQVDVILTGDCAGGFTRDEAIGFRDPSRARAVVVGDLDGDQRADLVSAGKHYLRTWITSGGCLPPIRVTLDGGGRDRHGIGARVGVTVGGQTTYRWMLPDTTASASLPELYFGLGDARSAERIEVLWLDGAVTVLEDVEAGADLHLSR